MLFLFLFILFLVSFTIVNGLASSPNKLIILLDEFIDDKLSIFLSVIILNWTFIVCNSWINNLNVYGIRIILNDLPYLLIFSIFPTDLSSIVSVNFIGPSTYGLINKLRLSLYIAIIPVWLQTATKYSSPRISIDSWRNLVAPCAIIPSRSISPIRKPPSFALPWTVCLVKACLGPLER